MPFGKGNVSPGRILCLLLAIPTALSWAIPVRAEEPPRPVSYYTDAALSGYPSLASMRQRITMKRNEAIRAGALDDPKGWIALSNVPVRSLSFREEDMTGKEIGLSQMFPYPGKRDHAVQIVTMEKEQVEFELEEMRNMLRADVKMAYAELSSVRAQADLVRRSRAVLEQVVDVSREMLAVGKGRQPDVLRGQIEYQKMREMLLMLENRERVLSIRLNTLAALPPGDPVPAIDPLAEFPSAYDPLVLQSIYREERPARKAVKARIGKGTIGVLHAEHEGRPDFEVSASYMQRDAMPDGTKRPDMVLRHGVDDAADLAEGEDRAGNPGDDGREGDGDPRRGDARHRGGQRDRRVDRVAFELRGGGEAVPDDAHPAGGADGPGERRVVPRREDRFPDADGFAHVGTRLPQGVRRHGRGRCTWRRRGSRRRWEGNSMETHRFLGKAHRPRRSIRTERER